MRIRDKLISNTTYLSLNWFFLTLFNMVFWIMLGKTLLPDSYGKVALFIQVSTLLSALSLFGLGSAIGRLVPELLKKNRKDKVQGVILFCFKWILIISLVAALILIIFSTQVSAFLKLEKEVLWITSISILVISTAMIFRSIYQGFQNMKKLFLTNFYSGLSKIALVLLFIFLKFDYFGIIIAVFLSNVILVLLRIEKKVFKISKNPVVDKKLIFKFSIPALTVLIFSSILDQSQLIILSSMKTAEVTGMFAVGMKISSILTTIPIIFLFSLSPIISGLSANKKSRPRQSYLIRLVFRYNLFFLLPMALFLIILSKYAILFFSSPEYLSATNLLIILAITFVFNGMAVLLRSNLWSLGYPKRYRNLQIISSLSYLFLSIPLTYYFSAMGLAVSYLLSNILFFCLAGLFLKKHLGFAPPMKDVGRIIIGCLISGMFLVFSRRYIANVWTAIGFGIIAGFIYVLSLLKLNFYLEEDLAVLDYLAEKLPMFDKKAMWIRAYVEKFVNRSYKALFLNQE